MTVVFLVTELDPSAIGHCGFQCVIHVLDLNFILPVLISGFSFQVSAFDFSFRFRVLELCSKFWNSLAASALLRGLGLDYSV